MSRTQIILMACLGLLLVVVILLVFGNRQPPILPVDADHASFDGAETCLVCHGPDGGAPQSRNHPLGNDCLRCHGRR